MDRNRQIVLGGLLLVLLLLTAFVLGAVLQTVVFTITVAYVLYPIKRWVARRGASDRVASGVATLTAFIVVALIIAPLALAVYQRREQFIEVLQTLPDSFTFTIAGETTEIETQPVIDAAEDAIRDVAVDLAVAAPGLIFQIVLFTLVLYGILYKPREARRAIYALVPDQYHDIIRRLHVQTRKTLFGIYVLQATTALATFLIGLVIFWLLGYSGPLTLAAIAGMLQFVPIVGPSLLVVALATNDILLGMPVRGIAMLVLGLVFIALTPDALIRTKLASYAGELSPTLYFVGFVGGILTIGALGIIIGPLVVALLVETVQLLSERSPPPEQKSNPDQPAG